MVLCSRNVPIGSGGGACLYSRWPNFFLFVIGAVALLCTLADGRSWQQKVPLPQGLRNAAAVSLGGTLYVVGGSVSEVGTPSPFVYSFDTEGSSAAWVQETRLPVNVSGAGSTIVYNSEDLLVCAGCSRIESSHDNDNSGLSNEFFRYNVVAKRWYPLKNATYPRAGGTVVRLPDTNQLFVFGGLASVAPTPSSELRVESFDVSVGEWVVNDTYHIPFWFSCCEGTAAYAGDGVVYVFNCLDCTDSLQLLNTVLKVDVGSGVLSQIAPPLLTNATTLLEGPAVIAQYAVLLQPAQFESPNVYFFDFTSEALSYTNAVIGSFSERSEAAVTGVANNFFVSGGRLLLDNTPSSVVDELPYVVPQPPLSTSSGSVFIVGSNITVTVAASSGTGATTYVRLSRSLSSCFSHDAASPDVWVPPSGMVVLPAPSVPGRYGICSSNGVCARNVSLRAPCSVPDLTDIVDCLSSFCCWDMTLMTCFAYSATLTATPRATNPNADEAEKERLFWTPYLNVELTVVPVPPTTTVITTTMTSVVTSTSIETTTTATPTSTSPPTLAPTSTREPTTTMAPQSTTTPVPTNTTLSPTNAPTNVPTNAPESAPPNPETFHIVEAAVGAGVGVAAVLLLLFCMRRHCDKSRLAMAAKVFSEGSSSRGSSATPRTPGGGLLAAFDQRQTDAAQSTTTKYRVLSRLGRGAHGIVYLVERVPTHSSTTTSSGPLPPQHRYAMKYIPCDGAAELQMALREFEVIRKVQQKCSSTRRPSYDGTRYSSLSFKPCTASQCDDTSLQRLPLLSAVAAASEVHTDLPSAAPTKRHPWLHRTSGFLGGHPNMVGLVDMFMDWPATVERSSTRPSLLRSTSSVTAHETYVPIPPGVLNTRASGDTEDMDVDPHRYVCIVMEYFPAGDLRKFVMDAYAPNESIPEHVVLRIGLQLSSVLAFLHAQSPPVVHRDVKPENVLVADDDDDDVTVSTSVHAQYGAVSGRRHHSLSSPRHASYDNGSVYSPLLGGSVPNNSSDASAAASRHGSRMGMRATSSICNNNNNDSGVSSSGENAPHPTYLDVSRLRVALTDFGLAHNADKTHMTTKAGTPHYAAPESWKGHYTAAVDTWALGCVLYVTCTRRITSDTARVMFSDVRDPGFCDEVLHELTAERSYSRGLAQLILSLLRVDPQQRPTAAAAMSTMEALFEESAARLS